MEYKYISHIDSPADLRQLQVNELPVVCAELRDFIVQSLSKNPGHLASSLGAIELTVALHYVMDTPEDKLVWDVGHQAYAHKILTGRRDRFYTNRQFKGISPFTNPAESEYDAFIAGHASNSISAALGMAIASPEKRVAAIIGDGALTGGLAYEGLNNASMTRSNLLIVLNDNNMAIDPIRGGMTQYLVDITTGKRYNQWRYKVYLALQRLGWMTDSRKQKVQRFNNNIKSILSNHQPNIFSGLNIRYFGPADGHDVITLVKILNEIKDYKGPKVLHLITQKGKGYAPAEQNQTIWHAPGKFNPETGERLKPEPQYDQNGELIPQPELWQEVFGNELLRLAQDDPNIIGITPAMPTGCSMNIMQRQMPQRVYDVGIAEEHAVTFSAGLAKEGKMPVCNIYSSFLQRAYDEIIHDVALMNLHVLFCIDRAGIVGQDGATHHGLLDLAMLRPIPNMQIAAPINDDELRHMMRQAIRMKGPVAIRYPRGIAATAPEGSATLPVGKAQLLHDGNQIAILSIGAIGNHVIEAIQGLTEQQQAAVAHYDMRWLKPICHDTLDHVGTHFQHVITIEDGMTDGGLGSAVLEYFADHHYTCRVTRLGVHDQFVEHGKPDELYQMLDLDPESLRRTFTSFIN
ncbi:MAG: 1-deoxy-D-xylulose-5-phosphate synthase [Paludibacteraceae bacterium]|nr:1-deoxy-D-xylulose-5-phosphate synthase [Paludibacteraceae bacterium]